MNNNTYSLTTYSSIVNSFGNWYCAIKVIRLSDGAEAYGTIQGHESNAEAACNVLSGGWNFDRYTRELKIREFNKFVKGWDDLGCTPDQIIPNLEKQFTESLVENK